MKSIIILLAALCTLPFAHAQQFAIGPKIGSEKAKLNLNQTIDLDGRDLVLLQSKKKRGINYGLFARIPMGKKWFLEPQFNFAKSKGQLSINDEAHNPATFDFEFRSFEAPMLLGRKLGFLKLKGGPVFSKVFDLKGHTNKSDIFTGPMTASDDLGIGYHLGFGFDLGPLTFDFAWQNDVEQLGLFQNISNQDIKLDQDLKSFQFNLGFKLFKSKKGSATKVPKDIIHKS